MKVSPSVEAVSWRTVDRSNHGISRAKAPELTMQIEADKSIALISVSVNEVMLSP